MSARILVVDDDENARDILRQKLEHSGHDVTTAESAEDALGRVGEVDPHVIITDLRMPGMNGLDLLRKVKSAMDLVDVVVVTGHEDMSSAVEAMKAGAFDYVVKPVDLKQVASLVERCLREQELNREARAEEAEEAEEESEESAADAVVGKDPRMIEIYKLIGVLARNRATVMIRGETGTGKEMVARAIHANSAHAQQPFIAVNCTALTDTLLESELFGHVKGAFTGATSSRKGYFELARSGTIFLDEIGDTSPEFQTKLLRVLQERKYYPVGGEEPRVTEARVVAATHQPIERLVEKGKFREDLYFRLKVVEIRVPPLRERRDDISLLASALLARIRQETHQTVRHISDDAMKLLMEYEWPGNVRELENALTRAAILARGSAIGPEHLSLGVDFPIQDSGGATGSEAATAQDDLEVTELDAVISRHVQRVLHQAEGNKSESARLLGISRSRLQRYVDKFELEVPK
ncbi:MAG: sigma-54 dependent transcriptional regulator [Gemmatimonadota bacterium]|jgi:two-component system response regulator AtoC